MMRLIQKVLTLCLLLLAVIDFTSSHAQELDKLKTGIVRITAEVGGASKSGSGFIVRLTSDTAYIVTASHVVEGAKHPKIEFIKDDRSFLATVKALEGDNPRGLALVVVTGIENVASDLSALPLATAFEVQAPKEVIALGFPKVVGSLSVIQGNVSSRKGREFIVQAPLEEGMSGGPVILEDHVVGLVTESSQGLGYATLAADIQLFLRGHLKLGVDYQTSYQLAESYQKLGKHKEYIETLEALLKNEALLSKLPAAERRHNEGTLHFDIALALMGRDYIEGISNRKQRALIHLEKARLLDRSNPVVLFLIGFTKASEASDRLPDPKTKTPEISRIFQEAHRIISEGSSEGRWTEETYHRILILYHYWYGRSLRELEETDAAEAELKAGLALLDRNPDLPGMALQRDQFLYRLGQNAFNRSTADVPAALEYWKDVSNEDYVGRALTLSGLGFWYAGWEAQSNGKEDKAKEKFDSAERAFAAAKALGHKAWNLSFTLGVLYFSRGDYLNAAANLTDATQVDPRKAIAFYWLGRSKFMMKGQGALEEAQEAMGRATELDPNNSDAYYWLGRIMAESGQNSAAELEFEKCIKIDSKNTKAYSYLVAAIIMVANGKSEHSVEKTSILEKALRQAGVGIKIARSEKDTKTITLIQGFQRLIWNSLAYDYAERGEYLSIAYSYMGKALKSEPNNPYYLDTKAWVLIRMGELSEGLSQNQKEDKLSSAEELLKKSLDLLPPEATDARAETKFHLGYIEMLRGRKEKAQGLFLEALEINPEYEKAKEAMK